MCSPYFSQCLDLYITMFKISIIIPVYNSEPFLRKCLESIVAQTFCNFECLLIDDGSSDNSCKICTEYAEKDSRFIVYHQRHSGVSSARNLGLDKATGEYVAFIDSDDYISKNYLSVINECNKDIILLDNKYVYKDGKIFDYNYIEPQVSKNKEEFVDIVSKNLSHAIMKVVWAKLIRREIIGNVRFNAQQTVGEDTLFMYDLYKNCCSIGIFNGYTYYWLYNGGDERKYRQSPEMSAVYASNIYKSYKRLGGIVSIEVELFIIDYFFMLCNNKNSYFYLKPWFNNKEIKKINTFLIENCPERLSDNYKLHLKPVSVQIFLRIKHRIGNLFRKVIYKHVSFW